ncbi:hypothetical protein PRZ48_008075 [Zasmidium cellare]|uniref:Uncharacterized protein n=1 Tax=Zasmidium cellare TaxID=395010 RepID=A0ABR0EEU0_ZASCE|nr:hypothetical protein PRZ48_008075 [Zasmidium cellare]
MDRHTDNASRAPEFNSDTVEYPEVVQGWSQIPNHAGHNIDSGAWKGTQQHNVTNYEVHDKVPPTAEQRRGGRRIAGLPVWAFWLILGALGLVVIGASVGGAVGGSAAMKSHDSSSASNPSSTAANPTSSASSSTPSASGIAITGCPGSNGTTYTPAGYTGPTNPGTYTQVCGGDNSKPQWVQSYGQLMSAFVPSLKDCIDLCSYWNLLRAANDSTPCTVAALIPNGQPPYNCWIRNSWNDTDDTRSYYLALGFLDS